MINGKPITESELKSELDSDTEHKFNRILNHPPKLDFIENETIIFDLSDFRKFLKSVVHCFDWEESSYFSNAIMFTKHNDQLYGCMTDGRSLIACAIPPKNNNYEMLINESVVIDPNTAFMILVYETDETELKIEKNKNENIIYINIGDLYFPIFPRQMPNIGKLLQLNPPEKLSVSREKLIKEFTEKSESQVIKDSSYLVEIPSAKYKGLSYLVETDYHKQILDTSKYHEFYHTDTLLPEMVIKTTNVSSEYKTSDFDSFLLATSSLSYIFDLIETDNIEIKYTDEKSPVIIDNDSCRIVIMPCIK